jgi:hypothetical protein
MSSNKSMRVLVAAALVAALFLAVPAAALDGRGAPLSLMERLAAWFVETFSDELAGGTGPAATDDPQSPTAHGTNGEGDPEGCRDYSACIDPNG